MSVTFSSNMGSFEILNERVRCGFNPASRQMRCTLVWLMPTAFAMLRTLQCVALGGVSRASYWESRYVCNLVARGGRLARPAPTAASPRNLRWARKPDHVGLVPP